MHRAGQRCFELFALIDSLSFSNEVIPQLDKTLGRTGQTFRACTAAEALYGINDFSLVVLKKKKKSGSRYDFPGVDHEGRQTFWL